MVIRHHPPTPNSGAHQIFIGRIIHSKSLTHLEILSNAALGVKPNGTIAFIENRDVSRKYLRTHYTADGFANAPVTVLKRSQFLFPGLIDTHLHAPQWPNLALGMEGTLKDWVEHWTDPIEASYSDVAKARRVYAEVVATTLRLGSTTVAYNSTIHVDATKALIDAVVAGGQRAVVGKSCILVGSTRGNWEESVGESLRGSEEVILYARRVDPEGRVVRPCVQPRGGPYCPPELMEGLGRLREKYGCAVQAHMCETQSDIDRTLALHPTHATYTSIYASHSLLTPSAILAHSIHLQPTDKHNLAISRASVAHNPNSNTCLRDGECRVRDLLDLGINVGLGTDCSAGYMPSILDAMRSASNVSRHLALHSGEERYVLGFSELVFLATLGGARAVGMEDRVGSFEVGKGFDALIVDVEGVVSVGTELWWEEDGLAMVKKWVFLGDDRTIRKVFVDGRMVAGHDMHL